MLSTVEKIAFLKGTELFSDAPMGDLEGIAAVAQEVHFADDQTLFREGEKGDALYFVVCGQVRIHKSGMEIIRRGRNECIGEMAIIDEGPRSASVSSVGDALLLRIGRDDFYRAAQGNVRLLQNILKIMVSKLRENTDREIEVAREQERRIMHEKMVSLGNLVAGVAHEMNNPIGAVHSAADVASRGVRKIRTLMQDTPNLNDSDRNERQLQQCFKVLEANHQLITTASERIGKIVESLKVFARLDEALFQKVDLHENIDATLTLFHHELRDKATIVKEYGDIPRVLGYPGELNQMLMNLLRNAVQAIEQQGTITITTYTDKAWVYVTISDTGKGIPPGVLPRIFDPGFTTRGGGVGTGLGLSIVYNIVQKHRGDIKVNSEVGKGTEFTVALPIE